jgi:histidyl-tRNA synthetase
MFRHERPQIGRLRQFYQIGTEQVGGSNLSSKNGKDYGFRIQQDFESIFAAWSCINKVFALAEERPQF